MPPQHLAISSPVLQQWHRLPPDSSLAMHPKHISVSSPVLQQRYCLPFTKMVALLRWQHCNFFSKCMYKYICTNYHVLTHIHKYMYGVSPLSHSYIHININNHIGVDSLSLCLCSSSPARRRLPYGGLILVQPSSSGRASPSVCLDAVQLDVNSTQHSISISQPEYIADLLKEFPVDRVSVSPAADTLFDTSGDGQPEDTTAYVRI